MYTDRAFDRSGNTIASYVYGESSAGEGGILTLSLYNENGNQTHTAVKPSVTDGTYNIGGDCIVTESRYDADGNVTASIDGEGHKTSMSYDAEGQLKQVLQPGGAVTKFAYGKVTSDGTSRVTTIDAGGSKSDVVTDARAWKRASLTMPEERPQAYRGLTNMTGKATSLRKKNWKATTKPSHMIPKAAILW